MIKQKKQTKKITLTVLTAVSLFGLSSPAFAMFGSSTAILSQIYAAQIGLQYPRQILQYAKQVQQYTEQVQMYENMAQNMQTLPSGLVSQIESDLSAVYGSIQTAQQLGVSGQNLATQFQNQNESFSAAQTQDYSQQYGSITDGMNTSVNNALEAANLDPGNFTTQQQAMQQISASMANPQSRNAIMQAGVQVGQAEVSDLTKIARVAQTEENMDAAFRKNQLAAQNNDVNLSKDVVDAGLGGGPLVSKGPTPTQLFNGQPE